MSPTLRKVQAPGKRAQIQKCLKLSRRTGAEIFHEVFEGAEVTRSLNFGFHGKRGGGVPSLPARPQQVQPLKLHEMLKLWALLAWHWQESEQEASSNAQTNSETVLSEPSRPHALKPYSLKSPKARNPNVGALIIRIGFWGFLSII